MRNHAILMNLFRDCDVKHFEDLRCRSTRRRSRDTPACWHYLHAGLLRRDWNQFFRIWRGSDAESRTFQEGIPLDRAALFSCQLQPKYSIWI